MLKICSELDSVFRVGWRLHGHERCTLFEPLVENALRDLVRFNDGLVFVFSTERWWVPGRRFGEEAVFPYRR
jgi:hypothetical protein